MKPAVAVAAVAVEGPVDSSSRSARTRTAGCAARDTGLARRRIPRPPPSLLCGKGRTTRGRTRQSRPGSDQSTRKMTMNSNSGCFASCKRGGAFGASSGLPHIREAQKYAEDLDNMARRERRRRRTTGKIKNTASLVKINKSKHVAVGTRTKKIPLPAVQLELTHTSTISRV